MSKDIVKFSGQVFSSESAKAWEDFLHGLKKRGLTDLLMITSDAYGWIIQAVGKVYPGVLVSVLPVPFFKKYP